MDIQDFSRSKGLNNIPQRKVQMILQKIMDGEGDLNSKNHKNIAINRYVESNIPVEYWSLKMERDFKGDPGLLSTYNDYVADVKQSYLGGSSICLAGEHGVGKTFVLTSILKKVVQKDYSALYTTLGDIVSVMTSNNTEDKYISRRELSMVDFLVIDEFDPRFMPSENASDLFARVLETVFRTRSHNKLPTLMATNSPNAVASFHGKMKDSLDSLMKGYITIIPATGSDFRKGKKV